jgi:hypothetical protein
MQLDTWSFNMDSDMVVHHGQGHTACTRLGQWHTTSKLTNSMDMDMKHEYEHEAWTWQCSMDMDIVHFHFHVASPCPRCKSMYLLHVHVYGPCPCPLHVYSACSWCMSMSIMSMYVLHVYVLGAFHVHASWQGPCCVSKSTLHVLLHVSCPCPFFMSMLILYFHVHVRYACLWVCAVYPRPWCMPISLSMLHDNGHVLATSMLRSYVHLHVRVLGACPCLGCVSRSMLFAYIHVPDHDGGRRK